jgi:tetratricopeptide (TPR) repeat protein
MRLLILISILILFIKTSFAINIDSLIASTPMDSNGVNLLIKEIKPLLVKDIKTAKEIIDYALKLSKQINDKRGEVKLEIVNGLSYYYEKDYDTALLIFNRAEKKALEINYSNSLIYIYNNKGIIYGYLGYYNLKTQELIKAITIIKELGSEQNLYSPYFNLGVTFYQLSDISKSKDYYLKAKEYARDNGEKLAVYNNLATIEEKQKNYNQALINIDSAIANYDSNLPIEQLTICRIMRTKYLFNTGHKKEALLELNNLDSDYIAKTTLVHQLYALKANILFSSKEYDKAIQYADSTFISRFEIHKRNPNLELEMLKIKIESFIALEKYNDAVKEQKKLEIVKEEITKRRENIRPKEIEYQQRIKKKELSIEKLKIDNSLLILKDRNKSLYLYLIIAISLILILIVVILLSMQKTIQKKNQIAFIKHEKTEEKLKNINDGIVSKSLIISNITENLQFLIQEIENTHKDSNENSTLNSIITKLTKTKENLSNTIDSDEELSIANEDFYRKLLSINKSLSPSELKMCVLLKLNLNTKEISQINYQSTRTTEGVRYRIRKKLSLSSNDNLNTFLMNL